MKHKRIKIVHETLFVYKSVKPQKTGFLDNTTSDPTTISATLTLTGRIV